MWTDLTPEIDISYHFMSLTASCYSIQYTKEGGTTKLQNYLCMYPNSNQRSDLAYKWNIRKCHKKDWRFTYRTKCNSQPWHFYNQCI